MRSLDHACRQAIAKTTADNHRIVIDDESYNWGHGHAYDNLSIEPIHGAVVIVRPDQYVSLITGLDGIENIRDFFAGVLLIKGLDL